MNVETATKKDYIELFKLNKEWIDEGISPYADDSPKKEFFGVLNSVNISKEKYGFIREATDKVIPVSFDEKINLKEIKNILAERIKIKARATYENGDIKKLDIISHEIKQRKSLKDYA